MSNIHYVMPMAGRGSRFLDRFDLPKPLLPIYGRPFFYWSTESVRKFIKPATLDFVVLQEHIERYGIDKEIQDYFPEAKFHALSNITAGAVITCINGVIDIEDDYPIVFNDCDHLFRSSAFNYYCEYGMSEEIDGILLTFSSNEPRYSFVEKDIEGKVLRTVEKEVISDEAICGCYYFRNKNIFLAAAERYLENCNYEEFYMSGVYNEMIKNGQCVRSMPVDFHIPYGTPEEYEKAKTSELYKELM